MSYIELILFLCFVCSLKILNLSKWCLKQQVSLITNLYAIFLLNDSQMLINYRSYYLKANDNKISALKINFIIMSPITDA